MVSKCRLPFFLQPKEKKRKEKKTNNHHIKTFVLLKQIKEKGSHKDQTRLPKSHKQRALYTP